MLTVLRGLKDVWNDPTEAVRFGKKAHTEKNKQTTSHFTKVYGPRMSATSVGHETLEVHG